LNPNESSAYYNRGSCKLNLGKYSGAIEDFNLCIELNPEDISAFFNRGVSKLELNDKTGACKDLNKALELGDSDAVELIQDVCK